jgi:hypothetical protein
VLGTEHDRLTASPVVAYRDVSIYESELVIPGGIATGRASRIGAGRSVDRGEAGAENEEDQIAGGVPGGHLPGSTGSGAGSSNCRATRSRNDSTVRTTEPTHRGQSPLLGATTAHRPKVPANPPRTGEGQRPRLAAGPGVPGSYPEEQAARHSDPLRGKANHMNYLVRQPVLETSDWGWWGCGSQCPRSGMLGQDFTPGGQFRLVCSSSM